MKKYVNSELYLLRPLFRSKLSTRNKLLIYKVILRPVLAYCIQIWSSAKPLNLQTIQAFQYAFYMSNCICICQIFSAPWYIKLKNLHDDLKDPTLSQLTKSQFLSFHYKPTHHTNPSVFSYNS